jgi:fatty-acyl-CoA synthase
MMDIPLRLHAVTERAERYFADKPVITRNGEGTEDVRCYGDVIERARHLVGGLRALGVGRGDRVATLCWNHHEHLESYLGVPNGGFVLHTLNFRLGRDDLAHVVAHAGDRVVIADVDQLELLANVLSEVDNVTDIVVVGGTGDRLPHQFGPRRVHTYEELLGGPAAAWDDVPEDAPAGLCYTSATTGRPKGVLYTHRSQYLHALTVCLPDALAISEVDVVLPVVPFFHANAWGLPFAVTSMGATLVLPGTHPVADDTADLIERHGVTMAAAVPTVWRSVLEAQDNRERDFSTLSRIVSGGSAIPPSLAEAYEDRWGVLFVQPYGMTEASPITHVSRLRSTTASAPRAEQLRLRSTQGIPLPGIDVGVVSRSGLPVGRDGAEVGEVLLRGPWVADGYYGDDSGADAFHDGWYHSGDVARLDRDGYLTLVDRTKDVIKSGGEWISSVALENALMNHEAVAEAAVVAVPDERWVERPVACVVLRPGYTADPSQLTAHLAGEFPRFWLPDDIVFIEEIPKTGVGKFSKRTLREWIAGRRGVSPVPTPS